MTNFQIGENKKPAVIADKPGEYVYLYEQQEAPIGCDFKASGLCASGHYLLWPLHDMADKLEGRGVTCKDNGRYYRVTIRAYEKIKKNYRISVRECLD